MLIQHSYCHSSIWKFCYSSYHTPKLKNIVILAITFSSLISKFYQLSTLNFLGSVIQLKFFWKQLETMFQLQLILFVILLITVLCHMMLYTMNILCLWAMLSIKRLLQLSPPPLPLTGFHQACCFRSNNLSTFFCSDLTDYSKNNAFSK